MSLYLELLYEYFVGPPRPDLWPEELQNSPLAGHGLYSFDQGVRLGLCFGPDLLGP